LKRGCRESIFSTGSYPAPIASNRKLRQIVVKQALLLVRTQELNSNRTTRVVGCVQYVSCGSLIKHWVIYCNVNNGTNQCGSRCIKEVIGNTRYYGYFQPDSGSNQVLRNGRILPKRSTDFCSTIKNGINGALSFGKKYLPVAESVMGILSAL